MTIWGPDGEFSLAERTQPLVFAACDTGFAPVKSLIEHALSLDAAPSISLFWLATRPTATSWPTSAGPGRRRSTCSNTR